MNLWSPLIGVFSDGFWLNLTQLWLSRWVNLSPTKVGENLKEQKS